MIVLVDNGGANLASVRNALARLGARAEVSADPAIVACAERVILPGVGAARPAMDRLGASSLDTVLRGLQVPLLGICLGMQLLFECSGEGAVDTLGIVDGEVTRFDGAAPRIPHTGWNRVHWQGRHALADGIGDGAWFYFVHSYRANVSADVFGVCEHGGRFAAAVVRGNFAGVQFHPELSGRDGARLLENFLGWNP